MPAAGPQYGGFQPLHTATKCPGESLRPGTPDKLGRVYAIYYNLNVNPNQAYLFPDKYTDMHVRSRSVPTAVISISRVVHSSRASPLSSRGEYLLCSMAGLLTRFRERRLPGRHRPVAKVVALTIHINLQQRDCSGLSPDSLLIAHPKRLREPMHDKSRGYFLTAKAFIRIFAPTNPKFLHYVRNRTDLYEPHHGVCCQHG